MVSAVLFDFYGTLAHAADAGAPTYATSYQTIFAAHGFRLDQSVLDDYYARYDGAEHSEHSISEAAYEAWVRTRLRDLTGACGVTDPHVEGLVDALRAVDEGTMVSYPEAAATICSLRDAGFAVGVCSNWGWELDAFLDQAGLLELIDVRVTSARAGSRKPHPRIYDIAVSALGADMAEVLFVGDSWEPDVRGPRRLGMTAVHVWREEERRGQQPPPLEPGDHRVGDLTGVLEVIDALGPVAPRPGPPASGQSAHRESKSARPDTRSRNHG